jgi:hypothetical protein
MKYDAQGRLVLPGGGVPPVVSPEDALGEDDLDQPEAEEPEEPEEVEEIEGQGAGEISE